MNPILAGIALAAVAGAAVAVAARDVRIAVLGLAVVLVASPLLANPVAPPLGLAARFIGAILAAYLLWIVARDQAAAGRPGASSGGSRIGWPAEVLIAASAMLVGYTAHGLGAPAAGPPVASAAGFAIAALALAPVLTGRDVVRVGMGSLLLLSAGLVVRGALGGAPGDFEQLVTAALLVTVVGVLAALAGDASADGAGGFDLSLDQRPRRRREPDAHRLDPG